MGNSVWSGSVRFGLVRFSPLGWIFGSLGIRFGLVWLGLGLKVLVTVTVRVRVRVGLVFCV